VRRPLELGAALAGAGEPVLAVLGQYGELVGEAFQLRDDVLGVFGEPDVTGKPSGGDLLEHKATSLVVLATDLASPAQDAELSRLAQRDDLAAGDIDRWRQLIIDTGAGVRIEQMISDRVTAACAALTHGGAHGGAQDGAHGGLSPFVRDTLIDLAVRFTDRAH
jgi:geranylgeranyl diphosphate synthase type I